MPKDIPTGKLKDLDSSDILYDMAVGGFLGGLGSGTQVMRESMAARSTVDGANENTAQERTEAPQSDFAPEEGNYTTERENEAQRAQGEAEEQNKTASTEETEKRYISMEDYTNSDIPVWNNVDYKDDEAKASITQQVYTDMINSGQIVALSEESKSKAAEGYPDLRRMKSQKETLTSKKKLISSKPCLEGFLTASKVDMNLT